MQIQTMRLVFCDSKKTPKDVPGPEEQHRVPDPG